MDENGHLTNAERAAYWQRSLAPSALLEVSDHLQECARCRGELRRNRPTTPIAESVGYEDLVEWMDGDIDPLRRRELAERIGNSPAAAAELINLLQFRDEINELAEHDYAKAPQPRLMRSLSRAWPLAAGLVLGCAFLWLISAGHRAGADVALIDHGQRIVVSAKGEISGLGALPPDLQRSVHNAISLGKVDRPALPGELRGPRETLAGAPSPQGSFRVVAPVGSVVEGERPVFRWSKEPGATGYRVNLVPPGGAVVSSPLLPASATTWTPHEPLSPNETYEWEVEALKDGETLAKSPAPPEPEARFRVLDAASRSELQQVREKWGVSHLVMGLAYARVGLAAEARHEFQELARENPQTPLPKNLLAGVMDPEQ
ncbi:MAG TPA: hypothetical protein VNW28_09660 [Chthoniobacterales bacterium]|jgi:hypothetical protein|nr:hypothetical protein [Chthoniobacterales bacterium]